MFVVQNTEQVQFRFLFLTFTWPLWLYTVLAAAFGALVWFGLASCDATGVGAHAAMTVARPAGAAQPAIGSVPEAHSTTPDREAGMTDVRE